jgi:hypothetical protein
MAQNAKLFPMKKINTLMMLHGKLLLLLHRVGGVMYIKKIHPHKAFLELVFFLTISVQIHTGLDSLHSFLLAVPSFFYLKLFRLVY